MSKETSSKSRLYPAVHVALLGIGVMSLGYAAGGDPEPLLTSPPPPAPEPAVVDEGARPVRAYEEIAWRTQPVLARVDVPSDFEPYDPIRVAHGSYRQIENHEAGIPVQCYTATGGESNPCYVCHTEAHDNNDMADAALQLAYAFSDVGLTNYWSNIFVDRTAEIDAIGDEEAATWVKEDNYTPLMRSMALIPEDRYVGFRPDLDFSRGFDAQGFAQDGSGWRAYRYKPFTGQFWPTNGNTDDVLIRLAPPFRSQGGQESRVVTLANLAVLEAAVAAAEDVRGEDVRWRIDPIDEEELGADLDGDGELATATLLHGLPETYFGDAATHPVRRAVYPEGTEFMHTVRYADPDAPGFVSTRMKELRYMVKFREVSGARIRAQYWHEDEERDVGMTPVFGGHPLGGLTNGFGWKLLGWIEDAQGRLRVQTHEEGRFCMGCHSNLGVTIDQTFSFARKLPGPEGWAYQDVTGVPDVPMEGHETPEILEYFQRVHGGDELRANDEMRSRFWDAEGTLDEARVRRAAPGGDQDITALILPSRERAMRMIKAYMLVVRDQSYTRGRDVVLSPPVHVHRTIEAESTGLWARGNFHADGRLRLDWSGTRWAPPAPGS